MPRRGKKRRELARSRREAARSVSQEPAAEAAGELRGQERPARARQRPPREKQRRRARTGGQNLLPLLAVAAVVLIAAGVGAWFLLAGGSSSGAGERDEDPFAGRTADVTKTIEAGGAESGSWFRPDSITVDAGQTVEILIKNTGTVSHNLHVSGADKEYDTLDDCLECGARRLVSYPQAIKPGETGRVFVKLDEPGSYPFRCDFHPQDQFGTLIVQ